MQRFLTIAVLVLSGSFPLAAADPLPTQLDPHNTQAPFCFLAEGKRSWRILTAPLDAGQRLDLQLLDGETVKASGAEIQHQGLSISVSAAGRLQVAAQPEASQSAYRLKVTLTSVEGGTVEQILSLRAAPPKRPIGYIADLVDDLIHIYYDGAAKKFRPLNRGAFDQYFRRLQAHGVHRLIVWHSPFPYFTKPEDHDPVHWRHYAAQARAIVESADLEARFEKHNGLPNWMWLEFLMAIRLNPDAGPMFVQSAAEHGIHLTASFRPFESALTKYYEVPTFDVDGQYLWGFLPLAAPVVNYRPDEVCFGHYRQILAQMNHAQQGQVGTIELPGIKNQRELTQAYGPTGGFVIHASPFPPIASDSFVLARQPGGDFQLVRYESLRAQTLARHTMLTGFHLEPDGGAGAKIVGLDVPAETRFLWLTHPQAEKHHLGLDREFPVHLRAQAGNRLQRETVYWVFDESAQGGKESRIAGITPDGEFRAVFQANQNSITQVLNHEGPVPLAKKTVVMDLGPLWSVEMLDFEQAATRQMAVTQLRTLLDYQAAGDPFAGEIRPRPVYDEIFVNTRSHVDLACSYGDGVDGQKPMAHYYRTGRRYLHHLGLDKAYAPRSVSEVSWLKEAAQHEVERITTWQEGEWREPCQEADSPFLWRLARNQAVGHGVTQLLQDLEKDFPATRIRAVIPLREAAVQRIQQSLDELSIPGGSAYGRDYYQRLWCSNNHIPTIGEGMALVDLTGTNIEPVFLGSGGYLPDDEPFKMFVDEQIRDLAGNRGSKFHGPRSYFFEAQFTLRAANPAEARQHRERMICELLSRRADIGEVLLYEATDWLHTLPVDDPDYCSHAFTERCRP